VDRRGAFPHRGVSLDGGAGGSETGRAPFDLIEAESELVAGYNIEYTGMKFGLFMANEFMHAFTANMLLVVIFFGGWQGPGAEQIPILGFVYLMGKTAVIYVLSLILRATIPRVRIDQIMSFNWKFLVPISILNMLVVAAALQVVKGLGLAPSPENAHDFIANLPQALILLLVNLGIVGVILTTLRNRGRSERMAAERMTADMIAREEVGAASPAH